MVSAIILAAGQGQRMRSQLPKVLHKVAGRAMVGHAIDTARKAGATQIIVVTAPAQDSVRAYCDEVCADIRHAIQETPQGTGDAVRCAMALATEGRALVLFGDTPLMRAETLRGLAEDKACVSVLGFRPAAPDGYGRIVLRDGAPVQIIEHKDADAQTRAIDLCNGGAMAFDVAEGASLLQGLKNDNAQGEYYLTDLVGLAVAAGLTTGLVEGASEEVMGVDTRAGLARAEAIMQTRLRESALDKGATLENPETVFLSYDTELAEDVYVEPYVKIGVNVRVGRGTVIRAFTHIEGAVIGADAMIGPHARLREGTVLGARVRIGNFVETKQARFADGAKANHLAYLGDAEIGAGANIGAGTITCNYDGYVKAQTVIGDGAFIGSNSSLIAPIEIGAGAYLGSASAVSKDVEPDALAVTRAKRRDVRGWAAKFRTKQNKGQKG